MVAIWNTYWNQVLPSRTRIDETLQVIFGEKGFELPAEFDVPGAENMHVTFPQKKTLPLKMINVLQRTRPKLKRHPIGHTPRAQSVSSNIEVWINAVCDKAIDWRKLIGTLFLEGECAVIAVPSPANWSRKPDFLDTLEYAEWKKLSPKVQKKYTKDDEDSENEESTYTRRDDDGVEMPKDRFRVDSRGRAPDDPYYLLSKRKFKEDRKKSQKEFEEEEKHWLAERLPFSTRIIHANDCAPIFGDNDQLEGLIVKTEYNTESLIARDYIWEDDVDLMTPVQGNQSSGSTTLYEYWGLDKDGTPYVAYSVNGNKTFFKEDEEGNELADAVIDLKEAFGFTKLPVQYCYGLHFETNDASQKGVPFLEPVLDSIIGAEALATSIVVHAYSTAFGSWGVQVDPAILERSPNVLLENGVPRTWEFKPLTTTVLPGRPYPMVHQGVGRDVKDLLQLLLQSSASMAPVEAVFGGQGAQSGHDRALAREYLVTSMDQVLEGARAAYEFLAEMIMEFATKFAEKTDCVIPVYVNTPIVQTHGTVKRSFSQRQISELKPNWVGVIYDLESYYPKQANENMAEVQQLAQLYMQGLISYRMFAEGALGVEHVEELLMEIWADQYLKSEAGRAEVAQLAAEKMGADAEAEKERLIREGRLTPNGTPTAMLPPEAQAVEGTGPPQDLVAHKLQEMMAHRTAKAALAGQGPLGATVNPFIPPTAAAAEGPGIIPPGVPGPPGPAPTGQGAEAPQLTGMSIPNPAASEFGSRVASGIGMREAMRDAIGRNESR
jgi:hypothetical protein